MLRGTAANRACDIADLLLAIATHEDRIRRRDGGHDQFGCPRVFLGADLLDAGKFLLEALAEARVVGLVGHHDVQARQAAQPADEIEVGRPQAPRIGRMVGHRQDEVIERQGRLLGDEQCAGARAHRGPRPRRAGAGRRGR